MPDLKQLLQEAHDSGATREQLDIIYNAYQENVKKKAQPTALKTGGVDSANGSEPFQQFKPGVNKYIRQPKPVPASRYTQGQEPLTVAQAQKQAPVPYSAESFKQAPQEVSGSSAANFMTGLTSAASGIYRIPKLVYETFAMPQNLAADILDKPELKANYDAVSKGTFNPLGVIDRTADMLQQASTEWSDKKRKYDSNITTQLANGDFGGAARQIGDQIEESIPAMLSMYATGPAATYAKLGATARTLAMAAPFAGSQLNQIKDNPGIPDYLKPVNAWLNGSAEVIFEEQFGTKALIDDALRVARTEGREAAVETIKNVLRPLGERFIKKVQPITNIVGNGLEEGITTLAQNAIDKYSGVDPNRGLFDNVSDAVIVGSAQGAGATALGKGMDVLTSQKSQSQIDVLSKQRDDLMNDLDSPSIPDNVKGDLVDKLTDVNEKINKVLDSNRANYDALSDDDIVELKTINDQIDDKVELINNESLSETSRQLAEQDLAKLQENLFAKQKEVSTKIKQFKTEQNAIQKPSTESQVPYTGETGETITEGGEGVRPSIEGEKVTKEISPEEKVKKSELVDEYISKLNEVKDKSPETFWSVDKPFQDSEGNIDREKLLEAANNGKVIKTDAGFGVVGDDGDIKGVFKYDLDSKEKTGDAIIKEAVKQGGIKLDNFALPNLMKVYERNGFKVVSRLPFNEEYAPAGWNKEVNGTPDVVAMVYDPNNTLDIKPKEFEDYDEAIAYRDSYANKIAQGQEAVIGAEPTPVANIASKIRGLKINLGEGTAQSNIAGLPIAVYNAAIETIALSLEAGESLTNAINKAIKENKLRGEKEFDTDSFIANIEEATGEKVTRDTSIVNAEVEAKRAAYGMGEPTKTLSVSNPETLAKAQQAIKDGVSVTDVIDKAIIGQPITDVESAMISVYMATKEAELIKIDTKIEETPTSSALDFSEAVEKRNKTIDELLRAYDAGKMSGSVSAKALQARNIRVLQDDSLAGMLIEKRKANGNRKLTDTEYNKIKDTYKNIQAAKEALEAKIDALNEQNAKLKLKLAANKILGEVRVESAKKGKEDLQAERDEIFNQMKELARKSRSTLGMNAVPLEMIPLVVKLAKNYLATGAKNIEEVIDKVHGDLSGYIDGVTKNDIRRAIADYDGDERETQEDIQRKVVGERSKQKQIKEIEELEDRAKKAKDPELAKILQDEADVKRSAMDKQAEKDGLEKEQKKLDNYKKNIAKRIDELQGRLAKKDYSKTPKNEIKLDDEARKLKKKLEDIKFEFAVELEKDVLNSRNKLQKMTDMAIDIANTPRALMATGDLSAPLRQAAVATVAYPGLAAKAANEMMVQWASSDKAVEWMDDLMASPGYKLMDDAGLYIANVRSAKLSAKEEEFATNIASKIPGAGKLVDASERAYVAYLNKMRVDIFNQGVELLQNDGYSYATNPKAFKVLANYVNAVTGRGGLGGGALEKAGPALNALMFSPRLLASRIRLLTMIADPRMYKRENRIVRNMYLKDMSKFVGFGLTVLSLAALAGADVDDDPRSTDFGKIKIGDTRWDIWGGFQQVIRTFAQAFLGQRKSTTSGKIIELDGSGYGGETGSDVLLRFARGKLAPVPSLLINAYTGKDVMGTPFDMKSGLVQMSYPLVIQSIVESAKKDGVAFGIFATGIPSMLGVGVQTYGANDFLKQGVDDKSINLLLSKKAIAIEPNELDTKVFDINTGKDRKMTSDEFKKYYAEWADHIKMKLSKNYDEYKGMSNEEFETEFRSIKSEATKLAKEEISGVTTGAKTINYKVDDEYESYKLTPEELKYRQSLNDEYIGRHGSLYNRELNNALRDGKSVEEAAIIANQKLNSKANEYSRKIILKQHKRGKKYDF